MSLCGWLTLAENTASAEQTLARMYAQLPVSQDLTKTCTPARACAVTNGGLTTTPDGLIVAIAGYPRWSDADLQQQAVEHGHALALADAYWRYDIRLFDHLHGNFALVILAPNSLLAAIDRIGQQPFYYAPTPASIVFGSNADCIRCHPEVSSQLSHQGIYNYVYFHMVPSPGSIYEGQYKLSAAHYLKYQNGRCEVVNYWRPEFTEQSTATLEELGGEMRQIILNSVERLSSGHRVGAFLSGGLDSSTVAGMLARLHPGTADTYSIGFAAQGYDEMAYARIAARHFKTRQHEYYVTPQDVVDCIPLIARSYDEPFGNSSAVPAYYCAKLAVEDGVQRLLGGDGGDEIFAGNARYTKQLVFEHYYRLPALLRHALLEPLLLHLPSALPVLGKIKSYIRQSLIPLPDRLQTYNFLHRHSPIEIFSKDFLADIDITEPLRLQRELYHRPTHGSKLQRMLYLDWQHTLADNDLRKVNRVCEVAGIQVVYPLLDDELVLFSCRIPTTLQIKRQQLRYFYKQAMSDFLPLEIIRKTKHGFGLPFGVWMHSDKNLQALAYDSVLQLKQRHYFQPTFIDQAIEMHRSEHAAYYGELIWILMILELWLAHHSH